MADEPLVSCLMVTLPVPERLPLLRASLADYCRQTYRRRELVIVMDPAGPAGDAVTREIAALGRDDVRIELADGAPPLGALRNFSRQAAKGEVHCQWDDDDRHHPERIARQLAALTAAGAAGLCLEQVMHYTPADRTLTCLNWRGVDLGAFPGALMCRADAPIRYPDDAQRDEDREVVQQLQRANAFATLADAPHLYVYVSHGANTWGAAHHRMLRERLSISTGLLKRREAALRDGLAAFDFGPERVTVAGPNGPAFEI
jgi:glycosyltransferase involved in cell wall biosynthesis